MPNFDLEQLLGDFSNLAGLLSGVTQDLKATEFAASSSDNSVKVVVNGLLQVKSLKIAVTQSAQLTQQSSQILLSVLNDALTRAKQNLLQKILGGSGPASDLAELIQVLSTAL